MILNSSFMKQLANLFKYEMVIYVNYIFLGGGGRFRTIHSEYTLILFI